MSRLPHRSPQDVMKQLKKNQEAVMTDKEIVDQIYNMCEADAKSERERSRYFNTEARGDPLANTQYGATSYGASLQAEKIVRFINQSRKAQD